MNSIPFDEVTSSDEDEGNNTPKSKHSPKSFSKEQNEEGNDSTPKSKHTPKSLSNKQNEEGNNTPKSKHSPKSLSKQQSISQKSLQSDDIQQDQILKKFDFNLDDYKEEIDQFNNAQSDNEDSDSNSDIEVETTDKSILIIINPLQNSCKVKAYESLIESFDKNKKKITKVIIAKHAKNNGIDTRGFWNQDLNTATKIDLSDILNGKVTAKKFQDYALSYAKRAHLLGRKAICLRDEDEKNNEIEELQKMFASVNIEPEILVYGENKFTETISIFGSVISIKNDPTTKLNDDTMIQLSAYKNIFLAGEQLAVHYTARSLSDIFDASKIVIIEDAICISACFHGVPTVDIIQSVDLME